MTHPLLAASPKHKTTALQRSIETGSVAERALLHPTRYRQHNPSIGDGVEAIVALHDQLPHDEVYAHVVRAFEDGDFAFAHVDYHLFEPVVAFDVHRYEDGVAVEHWDNLQPTPTRRNPSGRTMTDGKTQAVDHHRTEANKALVRRFTEEVLVGGRDEAAAACFHGDRLHQHDPRVGDGVGALLAARRGWEERGEPDRYDTVHRVLGEGSFVLVMSEGAHAGRHSAFFDLHRCEDDRIAERWSVVEAIPAEAERRNGNGKF